LKLADVDHVVCVVRGLSMHAGGCAQGSILPGDRSSGAEQGMQPSSFPAFFSANDDDHLN
jgi:hypothetical protein